MSRNASFVRKVAYIAAIALLLLPLAALSQPATVDPNNPAGGSPGGKLSQLRVQYDLSQAELGEIDPASETMKLATLGLRGVATNILWLYAIHHKKVEDWDKLELTVQQIIRLQPNFLEVWDFQAHNLSYNVSVEFDDYRMRYQWVKKGIDFLILGTHYNRQEPGLLNQVGWFTGQKMGRSDEQKQFRRMFRTDKDLHELFRRNGVEVDQEQAISPYRSLETGREERRPDNWLVARLWFNRAVDAVTSSNRPIRGKSPLLFYSGGPMSLINGSAATQKDGYFGELSQISWQRAADDWRAYGDRELPATEGFMFRLNELEERRDRIKQLRDQIDLLAPGVREEITNEKTARLSDAMRAAREKPADKRTPEEMQLAYQAEMEIVVRDREVFDRAPRDARPEIRTLLEQLDNDEAVAGSIARNRQIVNFEYWRTRCDAERTKLALDARRNVYEADKLFAAGEKFAEARQMYEEAWLAWAQIFKDHAALMDNAEAQDLIESIGRYRDLLNQLDERFPADFVLNDLLGRHHEGMKLRDEVRLIQSATGDSPQPLESKPLEPKPDGKTPDPEPGKKPSEPPAADAKSDAKNPATDKPGEGPKP
ncbi:MAG: hypothetical protein L0211_16775 [Planctomycetaceae bacterium]|nr:hypothetical protein [Planctomycetaceae bacterium]